MTNKYWKTKGILLMSCLVAILLCASCKNNNAPEPSVAEQIEGQWEISPIFMELMCNGILENADAEAKPALEMILEGGSVALHFKEDHHLLIGYRSDALAQAGEMGKGEYLDISTFSPDSLQIDMQWNLSSNNDSIIITIQQKANQTEDTTTEEGRMAVAIQSINETQLTLLAGEMETTESIPMQVPFFRSAVPLYFLNAQNVLGDLSFEDFPFEDFPLDMPQVCRKY